MNKFIFSLIILIFQISLFSGCSTTANRTTAANINSHASNFTWGTYGQKGDAMAGTRDANGVINPDAFHKFLDRHHIQTFNFLIGDNYMTSVKKRGLEYSNFIQFLESTKGTDIKVWITLVPPSEHSGSYAFNTGLLGSDEAALVNAIDKKSDDFVSWFKLCSLVASKYPNFTGVNIDDFINDVDNDFWYSNKFYTNSMLKQMKDGLNFYNTPNLKFVATSYLARMIGDTYTLTKKDAFWLQTIDVLLLYESNYKYGAAHTDPVANFIKSYPALKDKIKQIAGETVANNLPIVAGIYASGASWYQFETPEVRFVKGIMDFAKQSMEGVMIYVTQAPESNNGKMIYKKFEDWSQLH